MPKVSFNKEKLTIADVALAFPGSLDILRKHNLDFCCGGQKSFEEACEIAGIHPDELLGDLKRGNANFGTEGRMNFVSWDVPLLIDFVLQHHHAYVRYAIPRIAELLDKTCEAHGIEVPDLVALRKKFYDLTVDLQNHMPKEEKVIFPAIRAMFEPASDMREVQLMKHYLVEPFNIVEQEHDNAGAIVKSIRQLTHNYTPPSFACPTFRMAYTMLHQFDNDLMQHIHIENNIIFPRARSLKR